LHKDFAGSEGSPSGRGFWQSRPWRLAGIWQPCSLSGK